MYINVYFSFQVPPFGVRAFAMAVPAFSYLCPLLPGDTAGFDAKADW